MATPAAAPSSPEAAAPAEKRSRKAARATLEALARAERGGTLAGALSEALAEEPGLGPRERRSVARAARGVVRELRRVDLALRIASDAAGVRASAIAPCDRPLLRYLAWRLGADGDERRRLLEELRLPGPRRPRAIDDRTLARIAEQVKPFETLPTPREPLAALAQRQSVPDFLARLLSDELGLEQAEALLASLALPARLDLRANRLLTTADALLELLAREGISARRCDFAADGLIAADRGSLFAGEAHRAGLFESQDEGSQLIAAATAAAAGETVIDFCAGSGGKALALAAAVGRAGRVVACDAHAHRLAALPARARRARAASIIELQGEQPPPELSGRADAVLVDAPCSGIGGMRREVDLRWRLRESWLEALPATQLAILSQASAFVRRGGRLVYATCSPLRREGEAVVEAFLHAHREYRLDEACGGLPRETLEGGCLRLWPQRHGGGAFFAACLRRA